MGVKKALIAVSHCLQDCPPLGKVPASLTAPTFNSSDRSSPDPHAELFPHLNSWLLSMEGLSLYEYDASKRTNSNGASGRDSKGTEHEVVFRLLCSNNVAGSVIGKRGAIVRALESKTGASIAFAAPLSEFAERIVTISAIEVSHMRKLPYATMTCAHSISSLFVFFLSPLSHTYVNAHEKACILIDMHENTNFVPYFLSLIWDWLSFIQNLESCYSPAQDAVILVFARIIEDHIEKGFLPASGMESPVTARLLVASSTVNYLSGNEGRVVSELREVTGADIQILHGEPVPSGASDNDVLVQVQLLLLYNSC